MGVVFGYSYVKECNKRASKHIHAHIHGGLSPGMLAQVAHDAKLVEEALAAIDTQLTASLHLQYHVMKHNLARGNCVPSLIPPCVRKSKITKTTSKLLA